MLILNSQMLYYKTAAMTAERVAMRRSKLELYEDIICALAKHALTIDGIAFECSTNCVLLQERLEFLARNNIVTIEVSRDNRAFYVLTTRGLTISKTLRIAKRLKRLKTTPQESAQQFQTMPAMAEEDEETRQAW
jgi:predicted transcriptional regulator